MQYSLWRGDHELGRIHSDRTPRDPAMIQGTLRLTAEHADLESVQQVRMVRGDRARVIESPIRDSAAPRDAGRTTNELESGRVPLVLPTNVSADRILSVRDADGAVVETQSIMLKRLPDSLMRLVPVTGHELPEAGVISAWYVAAWPIGP